MAVNKKKQTKPEDTMDAFAYAMSGIFGDTFNKIFGIDKGAVNELNKLTKEQLIQEVLQLRAKVKELETKNHQDLVDAIREGVERVNTLNVQSGMTINRDTAVSYVTDKLSTVVEDTNEKIRNERNRMAAAYRFIQKLEEYKTEPYKEMFNKNMDKFISINPYEMSVEYLEQMIDAMQQDIKTQGIFNYGWNEALSRVFILDKARKYADIPKFREVRLFPNKDELYSKDELCRQAVE